MTRYFFHLDECGTVTRDVDGRSLPDLGAARRAAVKDARAIMCEEVSHGKLCLACHIDITTQDGMALSRITFRDAVTVTGF